MAPNAKPRRDLGVCPYVECSKSISRKNMSSHVKRVHLLPKFSCENCGKLMIKAALDFHSSRCPGEDKDKFRCEFCGKSFDSVVRKDEHELDHPPQSERLPTPEPAGQNFYNIKGPFILKRGGRKFYRCRAVGCEELFTSTMDRKVHQSTKHKCLVLCPYVRYRIVVSPPKISSRSRSPLALPELTKTVKREPENLADYFHGVFIKEEFASEEEVKSEIKEELIENFELPESPEAGFIVG